MSERAEEEGAGEPLAWCAAPSAPGRNQHAEGEGPGGGCTATPGGARCNALLLVAASYAHLRICVLA